MGALDVVLWLLVPVSAGIIVILLANGVERQFRGVLGRPYSLLAAELLTEASRRGQLIERALQAREARLDRLERRQETGR